MSRRRSPSFPSLPIPAFLSLPLPGLSSLSLPCLASLPLQLCEVVPGAVPAPGPAPSLPREELPLDTGQVWCAGPGGPGGKSPGPRRTWQLLQGPAHMGRQVRQGRQGRQGSRVNKLSRLDRHGRLGQYLVTAALGRPFLTPVEASSFFSLASASLCKEGVYRRTGDQCRAVV